MKDNESRKNAGDLIDIIREVISQEMANHDTTAVCRVQSVNDDGTLNLFILPDIQNPITNIINQCRFDFNPGDTALLYKIRNRVSNSFVIAKYNAKAGDTQLAKSGVTSKVSTLEEEIQNIITLYSVNN